MVSVIVPIFKTPTEYLKRCVESLLNQEYTDLDIILIDDGSDRKEIDELIFSVDDQRVSYIKKENGGVSSARNIGLTKSKGDYIAFVDSDDWVEPDFIRRLVENIEEAKADLSIVDFKYEYPSNQKKAEYKKDAIPNIQELARDEIWSSLLHSTKIGGFLWNKLFKKELITHLLDEKLHYCEDFVFVAEYCKSISKAVFEDAKLYHYRQAQGNAASNFSSNPRIMTLLDSYQKLESIYSKYASGELDNVKRNTLKIALNLRARYRLNRIEDAASLSIINEVIAGRMRHILLTPKVSICEKANIVFTWMFPTALFRIKNKVLGRKM